MSGPARKRARGNQDPLVAWSKKLSWVLRHNAPSLGIRMGADGFVAVEEMLAHSQFAGLDIETLQSIVRDNDKKRYELVQILDEASSAPAEGGILPQQKWKIRAVQGHTLAFVEDERLLSAIASEDDLFGRTASRTVVHGTRREYLEAILSQGLKAMQRNHIHCAVGLPQEGQVISGMRKSCEVAIEIDLALALADGIPFFLSTNNVVLTPGLGEDRRLPPRYFRRVISLDGRVVPQPAATDRPDDSHS